MDGSVVKFDFAPERSRIGMTLGLSKIVALVSGQTATLVGRVSHPVIPPTETWFVNQK